MSFTHIGIVGAGGWGTALALVLGESGVPVTLWGHDAKEIAAIREKRENVVYLPGVSLPESFQYSSDLTALTACTWWSAANAS